MFLELLGVICFAMAVMGGGTLIAGGKAFKSATKRKREKVCKKCGLADCVCQ
jgi:hypothetical protein